jgi:maltose/maltodextrin transport system permease protein
MLYTLGIGFTNYSSSNLLDKAAATRYLQEQAVLKPGSARPFALHREGDALRVALPADEGRSALLSDPWKASAPGAPGLAQTVTQTVTLSEAAAPPSTALSLKDTVALLPALRALSLRAPNGDLLSIRSLREAAVQQPLYKANAEGELTDQLTGTIYRADDRTGFFTSPQGDRLTPGYRVGVGLAHYRQIFTEGKFREPFGSVFLWTVVFAALSVVGAAGLGLVLAVLMNWEALPFKGAYRLVLFLPYAVPGFISILVFKGLFNQNLGEVNLILGNLFGIKPAWFSDPWLAKLMLVFVNVWLGFPYMMVLCTGLIKAIPADLYEASAVAGANAWVNFRAITLPLILKPLTPLLISAFAFNFNNFVLISLLTGGRPDQLESNLPAGTTDILVSYTWRIAFQDSGQQFGLASAISTVIFLIVAAITLVQMRYTRIASDEPRK